MFFGQILGKNSSFQSNPFSRKKRKLAFIKKYSFLNKYFIPI